MRFILSLILAFCFSSVVFAQATSPGDGNLEAVWAPDAEVPADGKTSRKLKPLDDLFTTFLKDNQLPGVTVAVSYRKRIIYQRGFGYSDLESMIPMKADSLIRIASLTKPITGVAIMKLVDEGKLELDQKVFDLLEYEPMDPETVDPRSADITIRHLLNHTAGYDRDASYDPMFADSTIAKALGKKVPVSKDDIIRYMLSQKLDSGPGERFAYSNYGYCLLGRVVEKVTGKSYDEYVTQEILKPIKVTRMQLGQSLLQDLAEDEVRYYSRKKSIQDGKVEGVIGEKVIRQYGGFNFSNMDSHGQWIASAGDLVKFARELNVPKRCKWMSADSVEALFEMPGYLGLKEDNGKLRYYSAGWKIVESSKGKNSYHGGALSGASTQLVRRFDDVNWAILFNSRKTPDGSDAAKKIDSLMHKAVNAVKKNHKFK